MLLVSEALNENTKSGKNRFQSPNDRNAAYPPKKKGRLIREKSHVRLTTGRKMEEGGKRRKTRQREGRKSRKNVLARKESTKLRFGVAQWQERSG